MKTLISIVGTTGIGKTRLAIDMAKHLDTEILSCDSRQFYKEMKIGTAAPTDEELAEAKHHFIGNLSVNDYYSIGQFELDALNKIDELFQKHDTIIMVGGSMMYEKAVIEGLNDLPEANEENQKKLESIRNEEGLERLQEILKELDLDYYEKVDLENPRRLFRAIDVIWQTGKPYSELIEKPKNKRNFNVIRIGIEAPRELIYERINLRVDKMMEAGLLEEVEGLDKLRFDFVQRDSNIIKNEASQNEAFNKSNELNALKTVGYTELFKYLDGEWDLDFAISEIKKNSRRFAKRQLTWYRKEGNIHWLPFDSSKEEWLKIIPIEI